MGFKKTFALASSLALPFMATANALKLNTRQYQDPNSPLVINVPFCNYYQCTIEWVPGEQVAVNWLNPPSGDVQVDLMTNNNTEVAYPIATAPAVSSTCDAGAGFGQPGPNGATCGGFVFTVPSSWAAGNYSAVRAMSVQDQSLQSFTDKVAIIQNSTTPTTASLSIVSGSSVQASGTPASSGASSQASATATSSGASSAQTTNASASRTGSASSSSSRPSSTTTSGGSNGAVGSMGSRDSSLFVATAAGVVFLALGLVL